MLVLARRHFSSPGKTTLQHLTCFDSLDVDPSPSRDTPVALSSDLPAKQAHSSFLNAVIVRLHNPFAALVPEAQQVFAVNCCIQEFVYVLTNCHFNSIMSRETIDIRTLQYFLGRGGISDTSTGSNSNFGSSASGAKYAFVVFIQFLSSRSGKSGL
jgi:hypothetical protein